MLLKINFTEKTKPDLTSHPLQNQLKVYISHLILGLKYQRNRGTRKTGAVLRQLRVKR
jgi:hypothetical protein